MLRLFVFALTLVALPATAQSIVYVDADATGNADGTSWTDAYPDLQSALMAAPIGAELWVAEGTYRPTGGTDRTASFELRTGVALYGGFNGTETARDQGDWTTNPTILSGDIGTPGDDADNTYQIVTGDDVDGTAILDGFTVTGARADGTSPRNRGGGLYLLRGEPILRHLLITGNRADQAGTRAAFGAGVFCGTSCNAILEDVVFRDNVSGGGGGGMSCKGSAAPVLRRVRFENNAAGILGGGMTNDTNCDAVVIDAVFVGNTARYSGALDNFRNADAVLINVVFENNEASEYGGAMINDDRSDVLMVNVVFANNRALNTADAGAGALQNNSSTPTLIGATFAGNTAVNGAGALGQRGATTLTARNVVLWGNSSEILNEGTATLDLALALVHGGYADGTAILDADPRFVRVPGTDGPDDAGDLRLQTGSPALDAGDADALPPDTYDLDGDGDTAEPLPLDVLRLPRVSGAAPDLGAYEGAVSVATESDATPRSAVLGAPYPNPSRGLVTLPMSLAEAGPVRITLHDLLGRTVAVLLDETRAAGSHTLEVRFDNLPAGLYLVKLETQASNAHRLVTLAR
ncbi:MAG: T9SS type A sorting domain-containing protein [Bacteroidota bacterium]